MRTYQPPDPYETSNIETPVTSGLPHSREAEEAVVGAVLINPDVYYDVAAIISADDLYIHRLRFIWQAYERLQKRQVPIDSLTVSQELSDMGWLDEIGGPAYITALLNQVPTTLHSEAYAQIISATSIRRKLLVAANTIATLAYDDGQTVDNVLSASEEVVFGIFEKSVAKKGVTAREATSQLYDNVDRLKKMGCPPGILTGHIDFDACSSGLVSGRSGIVAGRPGQGKTALILTWIASMESQKNPPWVILNQMEMSPEDCVGRLAANISGLDAKKISDGTLTDEDWPAFCHAVEIISEWPLEIIDERDPMALYADIKRRKRRGECDILFNDYIGLFEPKAENRVRQVGVSSGMMKKIAKQIKIPVVTAAQVNRTIDTRGKDSELVLSDLKESGDLEADANWVLFINPDPSMLNVKHCNLAKNRDGKVGRFDLIYKAAQTTFCNAHVREVSLKEPAGYLPYRDDSAE